MKVMVLVKATADSEAGKMPREQLLQEMGDYNKALSTAEILLAGERLRQEGRGDREGRGAAWETRENRAT